MSARTGQLLVKPRDSSSLWKNTRKRKAEAFDEKREALLKTAAALFRRYGYAGVSLNDVADLLKITKPTLYYYVGSKDELLFEIVTRGQEQILAFLRTVDKSPGMTGAEKLASIMAQYAEAVTTDFGACVLLTQPRDLEAKFRHQIGGRIRAADEIIRRILAEGTRDGTLRVPDPAVTLQVLFGSLNWIPRWYKPEGRIKPDDFAKMQVEILMQGVSTARDNGRPKVTTSKARSPKRTKA
jgi:AcrR family transcriptional regulator